MTRCETLPTENDAYDEALGNAVDAVNDALEEAERVGSKEEQARILACRIELMAVRHRVQEQQRKERAA